MSARSRGGGSGTPSPIHGPLTPAAQAEQLPYGVTRLTLRAALPQLDIPANFPGLERLFEHVGAEVAGVRGDVLSDEIYIVSYRMGEPIIRHYGSNKPVGMTSFASLEALGEERQWVLPRQWPAEAATAYGATLAGIDINPLFFVVEGSIEVHTRLLPHRDSRHTSCPVTPLVRISAGVPFGLFESPLTPEGRGWRTYPSDVTAGWRSLFRLYTSRLATEIKTALRDPEWFRLSNTPLWEDAGLLLGETYWKLEQMGDLSRDGTDNATMPTYRTKIAVIPRAVVLKLYAASPSFARRHAECIRVFSQIRGDLSTAIDVYQAREGKKNDIETMFRDVVQPRLQQARVPVLSPCTYSSFLRSWWVALHRRLMNVRVRTTRLPLPFFASRMVGDKWNDGDPYFDACPVVLTDEMLSLHLGHMLAVPDKPGGRQAWSSFKVEDLAHFLKKGDRYVSLDKATMERYLGEVDSVDANPKDRKIATGAWRVLPEEPTGTPPSPQT